MPLDTREQRVVERLGELPDLRARADFRARLREDFSSGRIEEKVPTRPPGRPGWIRGAALAAAVAVLIVIGLGLVRFLDRTTDETGWAVHHIDDHPVLVSMADREFVLPADGAEFSAALAAGRSFTLDDTLALDLSLGDLLSVQVTPGTTVRLPDVSGNRRMLAAHLARGEVRVTTGRGFAGARLSWETPGADVMVTGTTFAVIRGGDSTCVCVFEGAVRVRSGSGTETPLDAGHRQVLVDDSDSTRTEPITPMEAMKLQMFRDAVIERTASQALKP